MQPMPQKDFRWVTNSRALKSLERRLPHISEKASTGYVIECDLDYPSSLHFLHDENPLCPENIELDENSLSPITRETLLNLNGSDKYTATKLLTTLHSKKNYIVHYRALQLYLKLGMKLKKIHRALKFTQSNYLVKYIELCTLMRSRSTNEIEKTMFKTLCNVIYGVSITNVHNFVHVRLVKNDEKAKKLFSSPFFQTMKIINEKLIIIMERSSVSVLNKPIFIGQAILDLSKTFMYETYYENLIPYFQSLQKGCQKTFPIALNFTDTDSYMFSAQMTDKDKFFADNKAWMDFSNLNPSNKLFNAENKARLFRFKDEFKGEICKEVVCLKSKVYSFKLATKTGVVQKNICKGLGRKGRDKLLFEQYKKCLLNFKVVRQRFSTIEKKKFALTTVEKNRIALNCFDSKRFVLNCNVHTAAFGSILIKPNGYCFKCSTQ
jgi:hypothetical protein